jgi:hypothetical protein
MQNNESELSSDSTDVPASRRFSPPFGKLWRHPLTFIVLVWAFLWAAFYMVAEFL